jgi:hypothetical protein
MGGAARYWACPGGLGQPNVSGRHILVTSFTIHGYGDCIAQEALTQASRKRDCFPQADL